VEPDQVSSLSRAMKSSGRGDKRWGAAVIAGIVDAMKVTCLRAAAARAISSPVAAA
jgi:hypothetical protein